MKTLALLVIPLVFLTPFASANPACLHLSCSTAVFSPVVSTPNVSIPNPAASSFVPPAQATSLPQTAYVPNLSGGNLSGGNLNLSNPQLTYALSSQANAATLYGGGGYSLMASANGLYMLGSGGSPQGPSAVSNVLRIQPVNGYPGIIHMPEPGSFLTIGSGLMLTAFLLRRRIRKT